MGDGPVAVLVMSFLMWQATSVKAAAAFDRLSDATVDFNDLRVTLPHEIVDLIGPRYPMALERAERLRTVLRDVAKHGAMPKKPVLPLTKTAEEILSVEVGGVEVPYQAVRDGKVVVLPETTLTAEPVEIRVTYRYAN